jgi:DNA-binding HxlR family transcriptional regulator
MTRKPMVIRGTAAQIMLAMRPAPISNAELTERFGSLPSSMLNRLVAEELIERCNDPYIGDAYRLTYLGQMLCPTRRELYATAEAAIKAQEAKEASWGKGRADA